MEASMECLSHSLLGTVLKALHPHDAPARGALLGSLLLDKDPEAQIGNRRVHILPASSLMAEPSSVFS